MFTEYIFQVVYCVVGIYFIPVIISLLWLKFRVREATMSDLGYVFTPFINFFFALIPLLVGIFHLIEKIKVGQASHSLLGWINKGKV